MGSRGAALRQRVRAARERWGRPARAIDIALLSEATELAKSVADHPRSETIVLVEGSADYGNVRGALDLLMQHVPRNLLVYVSSSEEGAEWARKRGAETLHWQFETDVAARSALFHRVMTATVSLHENHDFWRDPLLKMLRSMLAGSRKVQLWHGRPAPYEKAFGRELLDSSWNFAMFTDLATTTVPWDCLVTDAEEVGRRSKQIPAMDYVFDLSPRMLGPLSRVRNSPGQRSGRVLVAPSYPSGELATEVVERRTIEIAEAAKSVGLTPVMRLHPLTSARLEERLSAMAVQQDSERGIYDRIDTYDAIVTDLSSLANDFHILGRPVLLDMTSIRACTMERDFNRLADARYPHLIEEPEQAAEMLRANVLDAAPGDPLSEAEMTRLGFEQPLGARTVEAIMRLHESSLAQSAQRFAAATPEVPGA